MSKLNKYRILELKKSNFIQYGALAKVTGKNAARIQYWANIPLDSKSSIPSDDLKKIAEYFGLSMDDMYTKAEVAA